MRSNDICYIIFNIITPTLQHIRIRSNKFLAMPMVPRSKFLIFLLCCSLRLHGKNINIIKGQGKRMNFLVSSQNIRNSELFKRLNIKTAKETDIIDDTAQSIETEDIVHCGVFCSTEETCSGLHYNRETKACRRMKKFEEINCPSQC